MNQLIAKIREQSRTTNKYRKVISDKSIFVLPDNLDNAVAYNPNTLLDDGDWFVITEFSSKEYFLDLLVANFDSVDYEQLGSREFEKLDFLFSYQDENYFFQNILKSQLVRKKLISFGEPFSFDENSASIVIKDIADAIYDKNKDNLYFRKLSSITSIFGGIDQLHREATETETAKFLNSDFISLINNFSSHDVKIANRKRIALALDTLRNFNDRDKDTVFEYIHDYCPELSATNNSFSIGGENDLKMLLFGIEQRFYTTPVGEERRIANSIISMNQESTQNG
jgi:hypothetical protein